MATTKNDDELIKKFVEGQSLSEIARNSNLSPERVRQRLARHGFRGRNYHWVPAREALLSALEESASLAQAAKALGLTESQLGAAIRYRAVDEAFKKAKARWKADRREEYYSHQRPAWIKRIREIALQLGHTPRVEDFSAAGILPGTFRAIFGSLSKAILAAGLIPNGPRYVSPLPPDFMDFHTPGEIEGQKNR
jgi:hypothetical protein